jgi:putative phosphoesterase
MKIAILSDSHDHIPNLVRAVDRANQEGAKHLIHCGDLISPFMLDYLAKFKGPVHLIYGNNVGDQHLVSTRCTTGLDNITHYGIQGEIAVDNLRIGFFHYPQLARGLAETGEYDVVCCGHNHVSGVETIGDCLLLNPGDLLGRDDPPGFLLFDTSNTTAKRCIVGPMLDFSAFNQEN